MAAPVRGNTGYGCYFITASTFEKRNILQSERMARLFVDVFGKLSQRINDLQTQVTTEALQKKLASVQLDLRNTQKALAPAPKVRLLFTFLPWNRGVLGSSEGLPSTDVTLSLNADGSVHVELAVLNPTDIEAKKGQYTILICDRCKFAKEPEGFTKLDGRPENERYLPFAEIPAMAELPPAHVDVIPPTVEAFEVGVMYRCENCEIPRSNEALKGTVHVRR